MKRFILISSLVLIVVVSLIGCSQDPEIEVRTEMEKVKVGVVDQDRIWTESNKAKKYQNELNKKIEEIQKRYEEGSEGLSEEDSILRHQDAYGDINRLREELRVEFSQAVESKVVEISEEKGLDIVLNKQDIRYGGLDITDMVIESLK